jgi:D-alanine transfer protein
MPGLPSSLRRLPHLAAAMIATIVLAGALTAMTFVARQEEERQVYWLAWIPFGQKSQGRALQMAALERPDLLLTYGSSELAPRFFRGNGLLRRHRSGFLLFPIGRGTTRSLEIAQQIVSLGPALEDRPVVISISPQWFVGFETLSKERFAAGFSRLHALELAFSTQVSPRLKRQLAMRMLEYPETIEQDPILRLGLELAAGRRPAGRATLYALWPLGKLEAFILRVQDHWEVLRWARSRPPARRPWDPRPGAPPTAPVDWGDILANASLEGLVRRRLPPDRTREQFLNRVERTIEWRDFELLLRTLRELRARPLMVSMPLNGAAYDAVGISRADRELYYRKLRAAVSRYGMPLVDFSEHDDDPWFLMDTGGHPSVRGWTYYAQALDNFHRGARP